MSAEYGDPISIRMHLNELKTTFDKCMRDGELFVNLKKIYLEIKELECHLKVMEWNPDSGITRTATFKSDHGYR